MAKISVFMSRRFNSRQSKAIVDQFKQYLDHWDVEVVDLQYNSSSDVDPLMVKEIGRCAWFIQLFTDGANQSDLMRFEWDIALGHKFTDGAELRVAHTSDTGLRPEMFEYLGKSIQKVDFSNPDATSGLICSILEKAGVLAKKHGRIELPAFCQQRSARESIDVDSVKEFLDNFIASSRKGLAAVFPDRQHAFEARLRNRFERFSREGGLVRLVGFTLARYVLPEGSAEPTPSEQQAGGQQAGAFFAKAIAEEKGSAQLLLLDPVSSAASERMRIESPDTPDEQTLFLTDSLAVRRYLREHSIKQRVEIRYYASPYAGLVIFDDEAYVEVYHLGRQEGDKGLCGQVPILVVRKLDNPCFYGFFEDHFKTLWKANEGRTHTPPPIPFPPARPALATS
jgi:hypothetical protein